MENHPHALPDLPVQRQGQLCTLLGTWCEEGTTKQHAGMEHSLSSQHHGLSRPFGISEPCRWGLIVLAS